jgi:hypothetical protein
VIDFLWRLLQASIIAAVMCGNIYWRWTPNGFLAAMLGVGVAYVLTILPFILIGRIRRYLIRPSGAIGRNEAAQHRLNLL